MLKHAARLAVPADRGDSLDLGVVRISDGSAGMPRPQATLLDTRLGRRGSVSSSGGALQRFDYRISGATSKDPADTINVVGCYARDASGKQVRDGLWLAWRSDGATLVIVVYHMGRMGECHVYIDGQRTRLTGLDGDARRDVGAVDHQRLVKSLDEAASTARDVCAIASRNDDRERRRDTLRQRKSTYQQASRANDSRAVDQHVQTVSYEEAVRASLALSSRVTCVPSRGGFVVTPAGLSGVPLQPAGIHGNAGPRPSNVITGSH
jgi:hypothetical protein